MNILIIDDDEGVLIRLERTLETEGCRTTTAWSGRAAVSIAQKSQFDVLLVDEHLNDGIRDPRPEAHGTATGGIRDPDAYTKRIRPIVLACG